MINKLTLEDVEILNEGQQVKRKIEQKYGSIKQFYELEKPDQLSLKAIRNYCSYSKVNSSAFKFLLAEKLGNSWDGRLLTDIEQIKGFVDTININIHLYKKETDCSLLEKVTALCRSYKLSKETALMYRCLAKHFYFRNNSSKTIELYQEALRIFSEEDSNILILLHVELADHFFMERRVEEAQDHYAIAEELAQEPALEHSTLFTIYHRLGVRYNSISQHKIARDYFNKALEYAYINTNTMSQTGLALTGIGSTYTRENMHQEANHFYFKSLFYYHEDDINGCALTLNNIASTYCEMQDYENAIYYIEKALILFNKEALSASVLAMMETYAQIKLKLGDGSAYYEFFELLKKTVDTSINKRTIKISISRMIRALDSRELLNGLADAINYLVDHTDNETYKDELFSCMGRIYDLNNTSTARTER